MHQLRVEGVAETGAKSRVETQIKVTLYMESETGTVMENVYDRIGIPDLLIANSRWKLNTPYDPSVPYQPLNAKCVWLRAWLQCASDHSKVVKVCPTCVLRETRRTAIRKGRKTVKVCQHPQYTYSHLPQSTDPAPDSILNDDLAMSDRKTILIHAPALMDFSSGKVFLPIRLPCYSRHQNEKLGFIMHFQLVNSMNQVVAQGQSPPILITDDHKSTTKKPPASLKVPKPAADQRVGKRKRPHPLDLLTLPKIGQLLPSPLPSPTVPWTSCMYPSGQFTTFGPVQYENTGPPAQPASEFKLDMDRTYLTVPTCMSPISPIGPYPSNLRAGSVFEPHLSPVSPASYVTGLEMHPNMPQFKFGGLISASNSLPTAQQQGPLHLPLIFDPAVTLPSILDVHWPPVTSTRVVIDQLIPSQGPVKGGNDITIIGAGFQNGANVQFGKNLADTTFYSSTMLMCKLPASLVPGIVDVRLVTALNGTCCSATNDLFRFKYI